MVVALKLLVVLVKAAVHLRKFFICQDENMSKNVDDPMVSDDEDHLDLHMFKCHRI